jgi:hypothetical protein
VDQLEVACPNVTQGCDIRLPLKSHGEKIQHHLSECGFSTFTCPHCTQSLLLKEKEKHLESCPNHVMKCSFCEAGFHPTAYKHHQSHPSECSGLLPCPNLCLTSQEEPQFVPVGQIQEHLIQCPNRAIECPTCLELIRLPYLRSHLETKWKDEKDEGKHKEDVFRMWERELKGTSVDENGVGRLLQEGDHRFYQTKNNKWIPIRIKEVQRSFSVQELSFPTDGKKISQPTKIFHLSPTHCHRRFLPFSQGFEKYLVPGHVPFPLGTKVMGIRFEPYGRSAHVRNGIVTSIDNQQVCINATEWYHLHQIRPCPPSHSSSNFSMGKRVTFTTSNPESDYLENFWSQITSTENIQQMHTLKRRKQELRTTSPPF